MLVDRRSRRQGHRPTPAIAAGPAPTPSPAVRPRASAGSRIYPQPPLLRQPRKLHRDRRPSHGPFGTYYHIYANDGAGGFVDYATPIGTTALLTFTPTPIAHGSDITFAVRAFDGFTGLEERNTDRRVRIVTDASGVDISARPNAPYGLYARPAVGGTATVSWWYNPLGQRAAPTGFKVWAQVGTTINYATAPIATVAYAAGTRAYTLTATGLADGATYAVAVRSTNAAGDEPNTVVVTVVGSTAGPAAVDDATTSYSESP